jgi:hypothetical protein
MTSTGMITDALIDAALIRILERIDVVLLEHREAALESKAELAAKMPRPEMPPTPAEWKRRIESAILQYPDRKTSKLAEIADVTPQTIRVYRKRMKMEGRI